LITHLAHTDHGPYPIHVGVGLLASGTALRSALPPGAVLVVTDSNVAALHLPALLEALGEAVVATVVLEPGEDNKDFAAWQRVIDGLIDAGISRDGGVVALGGGVVGDIAGFAAATYLRGVPVIQVPTTLLAQVDAAIGGKTAIDHPAGKNLVGAFHQPSAVVADTAVLATLDDRQYRSAIAEVIKHAIISDASFFAQLEQDLDGLLDRDSAIQLAVISRCCEIKAAIVADDEHEVGQRAWLNLGHSFAHAIESASGFTVLHGEAVSVGLVLAARLAMRLGRCSSALLERIAALLVRARLPTTVPEGLSPEDLIKRMAHDKKRDGSGLRLVLPEDIGRVALVAAPPRGELLEFLHGAKDPR
jgi:3-dehydroquinate synthase